MRNAGSLSSGSRKSSGRSQKQDKGSGRNKTVQRYASNEKDYIFWCSKCNVPLIGKECNICAGEGKRIDLSQPADVRFCSPYEREVLHSVLMAGFGTDPLGDRIILLNKIPGDDKTDEVIIDSLLFGILRFDMKDLDYIFEPSVQGANILIGSTERRTVVLKKIPDTSMEKRSITIWWILSRMTLERMTLF